MSVAQFPTQVSAYPTTGAQIIMPAASAPTVSYAAQAAPVTTFAQAASTYAQAAPMATYAQTAPAAMPAPTYMYPAGSAEVPVYGSAVTAPQFYQQPAAVMPPTVSYQQAQPFSQDQLKTIFPMGAPSASQFQPFSQSQYQYTFVDSASAFVPAAPVSTMPATTVDPPVDPVPVVAPVEPTVPPASTTTTTTTTTAKKSSKKASSSKKKLSSKKKEKGCC